MLLTSEEPAEDDKGLHGDHHGRSAMSTTHHTTSDVSLWVAATRQPLAVRYDLGLLLACCLFLADVVAIGSSKSPATR